ncbi:hypothetical protein cand_000180 [Cryptosporidium andersoni]|uniref:Uncharacterized protein n=1 Tax=Cryptosporidium andersoni TaxID=117008 RepID=A0A1J4MQV0_9CRYT|nr:hypothetical protein cand_000180 [Cryptosporidium andersoni]
MRAAWGALKEAVQELNEVLLEDETNVNDEEFSKLRKDMGFKHTVNNLKDTRLAVNNDYSTTLLDDNIILEHESCLPSEVTVESRLETTFTTIEHNSEYADRIDLVSDKHSRQIEEDTQLFTINKYQEEDLSPEIYQCDKSIADDKLFISESTKLNSKSDTFVAYNPTFIRQLNQIFQVEVNDLQDLSNTLLGHYGDWVGIKNQLVGEKELIIDKLPNHLQLYLQDVILKKDAPFSLEMTVLLGECLVYLVNYLKNLDTSKSEMNEFSKGETKVELSDFFASIVKENEDLKTENMKLLTINHDYITELERLNGIDSEATELRQTVKDMTTALEQTKVEITTLRNYANSLTSIVECFQTEEEETNARHQMELENVREEARRLKDQIQLLNICESEVRDMKRVVSNLSNEKQSLEKQIQDLHVNNQNLLENMERTLIQMHDLKQDLKFNFVDKRLVIQFIEKHNEKGIKIKYRDDIFCILCDIIGISKKDRERLNILPNDNLDSTKNPSLRNTEKSSLKGLSELFFDFLDSEVTDNKP